MSNITERFDKCDRRFMVRAFRDGKACIARLDNVGVLAFNVWSDLLEAEPVFDEIRIKVATEEDEKKWDDNEAVMKFDFETASWLVDKAMNDKDAFPVEFEECEKCGAAYIAELGHTDCDNTIEVKCYDPDSETEIEDRPYVIRADKDNTESKFIVVGDVVETASYKGVVIAVVSDVQYKVAVETGFIEDWINPKNTGEHFGIRTIGEVVDALGKLSQAE